MDPGVSTEMGEKYLPKLANDSPLENGIVVKEHTPRADGLSLWVVKLQNNHSRRD